MLHRQLLQDIYKIASSRTALTAQPHMRVELFVLLHGQLTGYGEGTKFFEMFMLLHWRPLPALLGPVLRVWVPAGSGAYQFLGNNGGGRCLAFRVSYRRSLSGLGHQKTPSPAPASVPRSTLTGSALPSVSSPGTPSPTLPQERSIH